MQCQRRLQISRVKNINSVFELQGMAFRLAPDFYFLKILFPAAGLICFNFINIFPWLYLAVSEKQLKLMFIFNLCQGEQQRHLLCRLDNTCGGDVIKNRHDCFLSLILNFTQLGCTTVVHTQSVAYFLGFYSVVL